MDALSLERRSQRRRVGEQTLLLDGCWQDGYSETPETSIGSTTYVDSLARGPLAGISHCWTLCYDRMVNAGNRGCSALPYCVRLRGENNTMPLDIGGGWF